MYKTIKTKVNISLLFYTSKLFCLDFFSKQFFHFQTRKLLFQPQSDTIY